jgi:ABC-type taurine transport system substrate-binding protein
MDLNKLIEYIPFAVLSEHGKPQLNTARILETILIGIIGGAVAAYMTVKEIEVKIVFIKEKIDKIEARVERLEDWTRK